MVLPAGAKRLCAGCALKGMAPSGALSKINDASASRPFDKTRDGFVLAEGASVLVLEDYEIALSRGRGFTARLSDMETPQMRSIRQGPAQKERQRAIRSAMEEGGLLPSDVDYINAHGTSTLLGDKGRDRMDMFEYKRAAKYLEILAKIHQHLKES